MAGHDINFLSLSGVLSRLGRAGSKPTPPQNLLADFAGGGLMCAFSIVMALLERTKSGKGQIVDCSMTAGAAYIASFLFHSKHLLPFITQDSRGQNVLDGGCPFYDTYKTSDGRFMAVGSLEPHFFIKLVQKLDLDNNYSTEDQMDRNKWPEMRSDFEAKFAAKSMKDWVEIFADVDACVTPVLELSEAYELKHNQENESFVHTKSGVNVPNVAPKLGRTPGALNKDESARVLPIGFNTSEVLTELDYTEEEIRYFKENGDIFCHSTGSKL